MWLEPRSKLLFIGDSITDCGRTRPIGEGLFDALGKGGYVWMLDAIFQTHFPEKGIRVVNVGSSGNTVRDLAARWQTDVFDQKPDYVSIMIGTNDVWRQFDMPLIENAGVGPAEYEKTLRELAVKTLPTVKKLLLATPFYIEPNPADAMRKRMDEYGHIVGKIARETGAVFVDTQAAFNELLRHIYPATIAWDRVHPNATGHYLLARTFAGAFGLKLG